MSTYWLIYFDDVDRHDEVFTDEAAARHRFVQCNIAWSCTLFCEECALAAERSARQAAEERVEKRLAKILCLPDSDHPAFDAMADEIERLMGIRDESKLDASSSGLASCGHDGYWRGIYGTCMVCRAEAAEAEVARLAAIVDRAEIDPDTWECRHGVPLAASCAACESARATP